MSRVSRVRPVRPVRPGPVRAWRGALVAAALAAAAPAAQAHSPIEGMGPFASGLLHPLVEPALLVSLAALGLLLGQAARGRVASVQRALLVFALALLAGLAAHRVAGDPDLTRGLLLLGGLIGVIVATAARLPAAVLLSVAAVVGLAAGLGSGPSGVQGQTYWVMLCGTALGTLLLPAWVMAVVSPMRRAWMQIAVRVLGSWLAAVALLVLSLSLARLVR
ncbi:MAG: HupE/UreJ family protein [Rubrivivax sp.]|nr:HupE/UreJ family protein [Rubrivivax sp.]